MVGGITERKILWLTGFVLPDFCDDLQQPVSHTGGWLTGSLNELKKCTGVDVSICSLASVNEAASKQFGETVKTYTLLPKPTDLLKYSVQLETQCLKLLKRSNPDIIHIFGTEYPHSLAMVTAATKLSMLNRVVVNIQGLASICALHCTSDIMNELTWWKPQDWLIRTYLTHLRKQFQLRGEFEVKMLKQVEHVIGRTTWDKACAKQISPSVNYHFCNETLRSSFYENRWDYEQCEKFSIFVSQANSPVKGLHFMLKAMPLILERFPAAKVYISGNDIFRTDSFKRKLKSLSYTAYLMRLIKKNNLQDKVIFTGQLSEKEMCHQFLKSHVFASCSTIENESNSLSEAKILGVPSVASYVGGVTDRIEHGVDGFCYQTDAPYMLAHYVCDVFENRELAEQMSESSKKKALETHSQRFNCEQLIKIYNNIVEKK